MFEPQSTPDFFTADLDQDGGIAGILLENRVPELPTLTLRACDGGPTLTLHPVWEATPEPGLVEALQACCVERARAEKAEAMSQKRRRRRRHRAAA
jgi:hypothetical protein